MPLTPGHKLGPYEIVAPLGAGGMGEVYRANDTKLRRDVALKVLPEAFASDAQRMGRFEREAQVLAALNHSNIAAIYGLEESSGIRALVMELVEGQTLAERITRGPIPLEEALPITKQIAEALEFAHEHGIIHRDLKPANIKIANDGGVKLLDFGLAKALEGEASEANISTSPTISMAATRASMILGTAAYMSPEQAKGKPVDRRADIWAFGCVLYEMLTGKCAFSGETITDTLAAVVRAEPDWAQLPVRTPRVVSQLLRRCLQKDMKQRLQAIGEARIALEETLRLETVHAEATPVADTARGLRLSPLALGVGALLFLGTAAGAFFLGLHRGEDSSLPKVSFTRLTYQPQAIFQARFAPDGRTVVFSAAKVGNVPDVYTVSPEYPEPKPLGLHDVRLLSVSSRGELAVLTRARWFRHREFVGTLSRVPLGGEGPREILDQVREADWAPDASNLAIVRVVGSKDQLEYPMGNVIYESAGYLSDLRVSPRGDKIAFFVHGLKFDDRGRVMITDLKGQAVGQSPEYRGMQGLAWTPDGERVIYSAAGGGVDFLPYTFSLAGKIQKVVGTGDRIWVHDVSSTGKFLVTSEDVTFFYSALAPGASRETDLSWLDRSAAGRISSDGRWLLFSEFAVFLGDTYALCLRKTDGTPVVRIGEGTAQSLSPDNRWALSIIPTSPEMKLMLYPTGPGEARQLERGELVGYASASWFPDGKRILTCGNQPGRATRCFVQDVGGGKPRPVTPEGSGAGLLSPDGTTAVIHSEDGKALLYPLGGGTPQAALGIELNDWIIQWGADSHSLLVTRSAQVPVRVEKVDLATGRRQFLRELAPENRAGVVGVRSISFSADGRAYAYSCNRQISRLEIIEGLK